MLLHRFFVLVLFHWTLTGVHPNGLGVRNPHVGFPYPCTQSKLEAKTNTAVYKSYTFQPTTKFCTFHFPALVAAPTLKRPRLFCTTIFSTLDQRANNHSLEEDAAVIDRSSVLTA